MKQEEENYPRDGRARPKTAARFLGISESLLREFAIAKKIDHTFAGSHRRYSWELLHKIKRGEVAIEGLTCLSK